MKRTLYDCQNARYPVPPAEYVYCKAGHKLGAGKVRKRQVDRNKPLILRMCQACADFISMGEPYIREGR